MESQADAKFKGLQAWLCRKTGMKQGHLSNLMNGNRSLIRMKFPVPEKYGDPPVLFSGTVQAALKGDHREEACVLFRHEDPLPFTLLSVLTHVGVG